MITRVRFPGFIVGLPITMSNLVGPGPPGTSLESRNLNQLTSHPNWMGGGRRHASCIVIVKVVDNLKITEKDLLELQNNKIFSLIVLGGPRPLNTCQWLLTFKSARDVALGHAVCCLPLDGHGSGGRWQHQKWWWWWWEVAGLTMVW